MFTATMAAPAAASRRSSWAMRPPGSSPRSAPRVSGSTTGDRVTFDSTRLLRHCPFCLRGRGQPLRSPPGLRRLLRRLPPQRRLRRVCRRARAHPLPPARRAVLCRGGDDRGRLRSAARRRSLRRLRPARPPLVIGAGMIGLLIVQAARVAGCRTHPRRRPRRDPAGAGQAARSRIRPSTAPATLLCGDHPPRPKAAASTIVVRGGRPRRDRSSTAIDAFAKAARSRWSATSPRRSTCRCRRW